MTACSARTAKVGSHDELQARRGLNEVDGRDVNSVSARCKPRSVFRVCACACCAHGPVRAPPRQDARKTPVDLKPTGSQTRRVPSMDAENILRPRH